MKRSIGKLFFFAFDICNTLIKAASNTLVKYVYTLCHDSLT